MMVALKEIFDIEYGNQLDFNKTTLEENGINFVTRSRRSLGIGAQVAVEPSCKKYDAGNITVTLGGTYLLSAFVQPSVFYTGQNIKVLSPKEEMTFGEKVYYCECISKNRFRYSSHGREANRSLDSLLVPSREETPDWVKVQKLEIPSVEKPLFIGDSKNYLDTDELVPLRDLFETKRGINVAKYNREPTRLGSSYLPIIRPSKTQISSFVEFISKNDVLAKNIFQKGELYGNPPIFNGARP